MYKDRFTGLYHTHFREYDPIHGRWLSEDPAGYRDGLNLYGAYMGVNGTDVYGLGTVEDKYISKIDGKYYETTNTYDTGWFKLGWLV